MIKINLNGVDQKIEEFSHPISGGYASGSYRFKSKSGPCYNPDGSLKLQYGIPWETKPGKVSIILEAQAGPDGVYRVEGEPIDEELLQYEALKRMGEGMQEDINKMIRNLYRSGFTGR